MGPKSELAPQNYDIRRFDPRTMPDNATIVCIGRRRSGKTVLVTDLLWHKRHIATGVVMSGTEEGNHYYRDFVPDTFVHSDFNEDIIWEMINRQKRLIKERGSAPPAFLILDDCLYDSRSFRTKAVRCLFQNGRHWNLLVCCLLQFLKGIPPDCRANCDYVFHAREPVKENKVKLYRDFFGVFESAMIFEHVIDELTNNYEVIVLDNTSRSNCVTDCVYYYKAKVRKPFRTGSKSFWAYHDEHYNSRYDDANVNEKVKGKHNITVVKVKSHKRMSD